MLAYQGRCPGRCPGVAPGYITVAPLVLRTKDSKQKGPIDHTDSIDPLDSIDPIDSRTGGDDRIRTCGTLLEYNGLANRRFQPLSHVSEYLPKSQVLILAAVQTLSRFVASYCPTTLVFELDTFNYCSENTWVARNIPYFVPTVLFFNSNEFPRRSLLGAFRT